MATEIIELRQGETRAIFAEETADSGTLTIQAAPAPKITLYGSDGVIVTGFNGINATGYDTGAAESRSVFHLLNTTGLAAGYYVAVFAYSVLGSADNLTRIGSTILQIQILPPVEVIATYNAASPTSNKDRVRFHCADTDTARAVWSDAEINAVLDEASSNPKLAAAVLLDAAAADASKIALIIKTGTYSNDRTKVPDLLRASAARLRDTARISTTAKPASNPAIFTFDNETDGTVGTMTDW